MNFSRWNRRFTCALVGSLVLVAQFVAPSSAIAIVGGSTSDPGTFPYANVGKYGDASAVFLGDVNNNGTFWVISAFHNFKSTTKTVQFDSIYNIIEGSETRVTNTLSGYDTLADLIMFQVNVSGAPTLTTLSLANTPPPINNTLYMAGYGGGTKKWDTNFLVNGLSDIYKTPSYSAGQVTFYGDVAAFYTLDLYGGQAEGGDSGGGVFRFNGSTYELSGIMFAIGNVEDVNENLYPITASANIASYYPQILNAAIPEPSSFVLLAAGLAGVLWHGKRRKAA